MDASVLACAVILREDGLGSLTDTVGAALDKGTDIDDDAVHSQRIRAEVLHDLAVKQHGQNAHGHINKESGKSGSYDGFP